MRLVDLFFAVAGTAPLPMDMLRYDGCHPATEADARRSERAGERVVVVLQRRASERSWEPSARWGSFCWVRIGVGLARFASPEQQEVRDNARAYAERASAAFDPPTWAPGG